MAGHLLALFPEVTCTHLAPSVRRIPLEMADNRSRVWHSRRICVNCHVIAYAGFLTNIGWPQEAAAQAETGE